MNGIGKIKEKCGAFLAAADIFRKLKEKASVRKNRMMLAVVGLLAVFVTAAIVLLAVRGADEKTGTAGAETVVPQNVPPIFMHEPLPPGESTPSAKSFADEDFRLFRARTKRWNAEEAELWWTAPDDAMLEQLHDANGALIRNVLESAP
jgi:hypothetical protein